MSKKMFLKLSTIFLDNKNDFKLSSAEMIEMTEMTIDYIWLENYYKTCHG